MNVVLFTAALLASHVDLREQGLRAATAAAVYDSQQPCDEVKAGPCLKTERTGLDHFVVVAEVFDHGCAFLDISTTLWGKAKNILAERNPILKPLADSDDAAVWLTLAKVGMQVGKHFIYAHTKQMGPRAKLWTGIFASGMAATQCGIAANNHRETKG